MTEKMYNNPYLKEWEAYHIVALQQRNCLIKIFRIAMYIT